MRRSTWACGAVAELQTMQVQSQEAHEVFAGTTELEVMCTELANSTVLTDVTGMEKSVLAEELRVTKEQVVEPRERIGELDGLVQGAGDIRVELESTKLKLEQAAIEQEFNDDRIQHEDLQH